MQVMFKSKKKNTIPRQISFAFGIRDLLLITQHQASTLKKQKAAQVSLENTLGIITVIGKPCMDAGAVSMVAVPL